MNRFLRVLLVLGVAGIGDAQTLYNNLPPAVTIGNYYAVAGGDQPNAGPLYNSFSTGSSNAVLTDAKVYLERMAAPFGAFRMALWSNRDNYPDTEIRVLGTRNDSAISPNGGVYDFPVSPGVPLSANTRYFIALHPAESGATTSTYWASTDSTTGRGSIGNEYNCFDGFFDEVPAANVRGPRRHGVVGLGCFSNTAINDPFIMQVTAGPVSTPAPSGSPLTGMAFLIIPLTASVLLLRRQVPA